MCKDLNCLPYEGGLLDQPAKYMEAFEVIINTNGAYDAEEARKQKNRKGGK